MRTRGVWAVLGITLAFGCSTYDEATVPSVDAGPPVDARSPQTSDAADASPADASTDARVDAAPAIACQKASDCTDRDETSCGQNGKCTDFCVPQNVLCVADASCCFGLKCEGVGGGMKRCTLN